MLSPRGRRDRGEQAAKKGPDARRRPTAAREAYSLYVERAAEGANEADGPFFAACYERLSLPLASFHVARAAQATMTTTTSPTAPAQPKSDGRNTAAPSFCCRPVCVSTSRVSEAPSANVATAIQSLTWPSPIRQIEPAPQPPAST